MCRCWRGITKSETNILLIFTLQIHENDDNLQDKYEEVDMITKGGNYGWHYYEGPLPFNLSASSKTSKKSTNISNPIFPIMWYKHSDVNQKEGSASITGGYFYRSSTDPCLYGTYVRSLIPLLFIYLLILECFNFRCTSKMI